VSSPQILDNGQAGFTTSGAGWTGAAAGYNGGEQIDKAAPAADSASWQTTGLAAGSYLVQATWTAASTNAAAAVYRIYDGSTLVQTVTVNQQKAPSGTAYGGAAFQSLATVQINSGILRVVLSGQGGSDLVADAVRAAPAPAATIYGPSSGAVGGVQTFTASVSGPSQADTQAGYKYAWSFGDGTTASGLTVNHSFAAAGSYTVTLTVTAADGSVGLFAWPTVIV
jgi:PKD repeat protein